MPNPVKADFLNEIQRRYGTIRKLAGSQSLFSVANDAVRVYVRYSKVHGGQRTFYGLREEDLRQLEGRPSVICFLWDGQREPMIIRFADYEALFRELTPASDGQYKAQVYLSPGGRELYIAQAGRFNTEASIGWRALDDAVRGSTLEFVPDFTHAQVQTLLGAIGAMKGYDIWIPQVDRGTLDWSVINSAQFSCREQFPYGFDTVQRVLQEVDVIWINRGASEPAALFEVEHSTPIYSGLLRFNDVHIVAPNVRPRFTVVANETRRALFARQVNRPTFRTSGLTELCTFLDYGDVLGWYQRTCADAITART